MEINVNGTANLNITVDADDTLARQMIGEIQEDVYGNETDSSPKDTILNEINNTGGNPISGTEDLETINEICNDPDLQQYFNQIGNMPPEEFIEYLKAIGYDDETHISLIWNLCQQEYIGQHESQWSTDIIGGGISISDVIYYLQGATSWLIGKEGTPDEFKEIGVILDEYFASDYDTYVLSQQIQDLQIRVKMLEYTMEEIASDAYCQGKIDVMKEYNLSWIKCGKTSSYYWNVDPDGWQGNDVIGITPIGDESKEPPVPECTEGWVCTKWFDCINGTQMRACVDKNACGTTVNKPEEFQACAVQAGIPITGRAVEIITNPTYAGLLTALIAGITLIIYRGMFAPRK
jgi:hypothetical protein